MGKSESRQLIFLVPLNISSLSNRIAFPGRLNWNLAPGVQRLCSSNLFGFPPFGNLDLLLFLNLFTLVPTVYPSLNLASTQPKPLDCLSWPKRKCWSEKRHRAYNNVTSLIWNTRENVMKCPMREASEVGSSNVKTSQTHRWPRRIKQKSLDRTKQEPHLSSS